MITSEQLESHAQWLRDGKGKRLTAVCADLRGADLSDANLRSADLSGSDLRSADLSGSDLRSANLWNSDLRGVDLRGANLWNANLWNSDLWSADLRGSDLKSANLWNSNLSDANLWNADLRNADLRSADLRSADLRGSDIRGVNLRGAIGNMEQIKSAQFSKWEVVWTADVLAIGCQQHSIERWRSADSRWIAVMDNNATEWWERYRDLVFALIDTSPATGVVLEVEQ